MVKGRDGGTEKGKPESKSSKTPSRGSGLVKPDSNTGSSGPKRPAPTVIRETPKKK